MHIRYILIYYSALVGGRARPQRPFGAILGRRHTGAVQLNPLVGAMIFPVGVTLTVLLSLDPH